MLTSGPRLFTSFRCGVVGDWMHNWSMSFLVGDPSISLNEPAFPTVTGREIIPMYDAVNDL